MTSNPLESLLLRSAALTRFPPNSRYAGTATASWTREDGATVTYLRRRFAPLPESLALLQLYRVHSGDRLDNLAAQLLGDPELYWRLCDANAAMRPDALTELPGRPLRVAQPEDPSGARHA